MYKNNISNTNNNDLEGKELKKADIITKKHREYVRYLKALEISHYMMLWLKYYRLDTTSYSLYARSTFKEEFQFTEKEMDTIIKDSKKLLKEKYNINVENEEPLILSSKVPFEKIIEKGNYNF